MGVAIYYMMAVYGSPEEAEVAAPKIRAFLEEMAKAEDRWYETRSGGKEADDARRADFPEVFRILKLEPPTDGDYSNYCAGLLDSPFHGLEEGEEFIVEGYEIRFCGLVWHFADWNPLARAMKEEFGALKVGWISEDDAEPNYYACIDPE